MKEEGQWVNDLKKRHRFQPQWEEKLLEETKRYYQSLNNMIYDDEQKQVDTDMIAEIRGVLDNAPIIYAADATIGYLPAARCAIETKCDATPWLVTLNEQFAADYPYVFNECLQIKSQFDAVDYVTVLKELHLSHPPPRQRLKQGDIEKVIAILEFLQSYDDSVDGSKSPKNEEDGNMSGQDMSEEINDVNGQDTTPIHIRLGPIYVPSTNGMLYPSTKMVFNDAPWLQSSASQTRNLIFTHEKVRDVVARAMGVQSFRDVFAANKTPSQKYNCTGGYLIRKKLQIDKLGEKVKEMEVEGKETDKKKESNTESEEKKQDVVHEEKQRENVKGSMNRNGNGNDNGNGIESEEIDGETLLRNITLSMFEIADLLESRHFEVSIDHNEYPTKSVLSERLTQLQGPSLLFRFDKAMSIEQLLLLHQSWFVI